MPDYIEIDHERMRGKFIRAPKLADVPYPVTMEPNLVIEYLFALTPPCATSRRRRRPTASGRPSGLIWAPAYTGYEFVAQLAASPGVAMLSLHLSIVLLLILLNGFFAMAEIALVSARPARLQPLAPRAAAAPRRRSS